MYLLKVKILLVTFLVFGNIAVTKSRSFNINGTKVHKECRKQNKCKNGGTCYSVGQYATTWTCNCVDEWSGPTCDEKPGCLNDAVCYNGGTCIGVVSKRNGRGGYCQCSNGWSGSNCYSKTRCQEKGICHNGGTCKDVGRSGQIWTCVCPDGWYGKRCDSKTPVQKNLIINSLCNNGGTPTENATCTCSESWSGPRCDKFIGTERTDFIALLLKHYGLNRPPYLLLTTNMSTTVHVLRSGQERRDYRFGGLTFQSSLQVKRPFLNGARQVEYKVVRIRSTNPISVTMVDEDVFRRRDITNIFPIEKLSTLYLISTADPFLLSRYVDSINWVLGSLLPHVKAFVLSEVVIVALYDSTSVYITLPPHLRQNPYDYIGKIRGQTTLDNATFEINLNRLEPFQIFHFLDFSGTKIHSSKPIAVFSGLTCDISYHCNHVIEQLPPVDQFDVTFIVPPNHYDSTSLVRVISDENTTIRVKSSTKSRNVSISAGIPHDIETFDKEVLVIQSTSQCGDHECKKQSPLLVNILSFAEKHLDTNRMHMTLVPGIHHYKRYYKIVVPLDWGENYITVIIRRNAANSLLMNGSRFNKNENIWLRKGIAVEGVQYVVLVAEVSAGEVTLESEDAAFGLVAYGYYGDSEAYAYAGNVLFP